MGLNYRRKQCEFCAFRPGSPERSDPERWNNTLLSCCSRVFHCHKTMFRVAGEERNGQYDVKRMADGSPAGPSDHQVCAGFAKMFGDEFGIDTKTISEAV